ncbi:MAG: hypothetical protein FJX76_04690 [Armatimonadetes bacterium]|nr:hypothetical protein [Armatimonadota bacterium]
MKTLRVLVVFLLMAAPASAQLLTSRPWVVGLDYGIYYPTNTGYSRLGLGACTDLAVCGGVPYVIGTDSQIWQGDMKGNWMPRMDFPRCQRISAGPDGSLYAIGADSGVYRLLPTWARLGLGMGPDVAADEDAVYVIGTDRCVWQWNGISWSPYNVFAHGQRVAAGGGQVYILGMDNAVYSVTQGSQARLGWSVGREIAVSNDGTPYVIGLDNGVWRWDGADWKRQGYVIGQNLCWPR